MKTVEERGFSETKNLDSRVVTKPEVRPHKSSPIAVAILMCLAAGAVFVIVYANHPARPGATTKLGWQGAADQTRYLDEAKALRSGDPDRLKYRYPFGYPFLASLFLGRVKDPFLIPNLLSYVFTVVFVWASLRQHFGDAVATLGSFLLMGATPVTSETVIPWTTTPVMLTSAYFLYLALGRSDFGFKEAALSGGLLALAFAVRGGGEVVFLLPLVIVILWHVRKQPQVKLKAALGGAIFAAGVAINLVWSVLIFGKILHPYYSQVRVIGLDFSSIPESLWGTLFYTGKSGDFWQPLLTTGLWMLVSLVGLAFALKDRSNRPIHLAIWAFILLGLILTSAKKDFGAECMPYHCIHYYKIWIPFLAFYAVYGVMGLSRGRLHLTD